MDPRDPRSAGDDLPLERHQVAPRQEPDPEPEQHKEDVHPRSLPAPDPERYGPVAPEPAWEPRPFNREKFLLWFLATAMTFQYAFLMTGTLLCFHVGDYRMKRGLPPLTAEQAPGCRSIGDRLSTVFELSVSVVLALMVGGGTFAGLANRGGTAPRPPADDPRRRP